MSTFAILAVVTMAGFVFAPTAGAAHATTTLHIEGMTCAGCETAVKMVLKKTAGVIRCDVSYEQKRAVVTYDAARTTPETIAKTLADALAYEVTVVHPRSAKSAALRTCLERTEGEPAELPQPVKGGRI